MIRLSGTPVLTTLRLVLRAPEARDLPGFTAYMASPRSGFTGGPVDEAEAFRSFARIIGHWVLNGFGLFAVTSGDSGETIGLAGHLNPPGWPGPELAWNLWSPEHEGMGYATEAGFAIRDHAFGALGWTDAISLIARDNPRSQAVARRLGAMPGPETVVFGKPVTLWRHAAPPAAKESP
ncbi:GNAT family N-acetyltransferase [Pseudogemmobacter humi]|uniref:N-acetyltransferase domain-containing protein n=1 Tax=Pseudogemmobacter humi TaxID=2483812 RepID=A0A3P5XEX6_9RHOB|nr:GNAT family N-acetyltransferase [Pseudogemmobacter humi]VDC33307.1 hypothetical protein XINFAN_03754 [Pseudogemmobacter humi]